VTAGVVVAGSDDFADEIGHVHLDLKLEKIDKRMELNVAMLG
jgi:YbbR domain-containing protein